MTTMKAAVCVCVLLAFGHAFAYRVDGGKSLNVPNNNNNNLGNDNQGNGNQGQGQGQGQGSQVNGACAGLGQAVTTAAQAVIEGNCVPELRHFFEFSSSTVSAASEGPSPDAEMVSKVLPDSEVAKFTTGKQTMVAALGAGDSLSGTTITTMPAAHGVDDRAENNQQQPDVETFVETASSPAASSEPASSNASPAGNCASLLAQLDAANAQYGAACEGAMVRALQEVFESFKTFATAVKQGLPAGGEMEQLVEERVAAIDRLKEAGAPQGGDAEPTKTPVSGIGGKAARGWNTLKNVVKTTFNSIRDGKGSSTSSNSNDIASSNNNDNNNNNNNVNNNNNPKNGKSATFMEMVAKLRVSAHGLPSVATCRSLYCPNLNSAQATTDINAMYSNINGCGPSNLPHVYAPYMSTVTDACTRHDICYLCGAQPYAPGDGYQYTWSRAACDTRFWYNMIRLCDAKYWRRYRHAVQRGWCYIAAEGYYQAVNAGGASSYVNTGNPALCTRACSYNFHKSRP